MKLVYSGMTRKELIKALEYAQKRGDAWKQEAIARGWNGFPLKTGTK